MSKIYLGNRLADMDVGEPSLPVSKVILNVDGETCYVAGDDTGSTVEADCPWATQAMANSVLARLTGFIYKPFDGADALLDPAAELGDAITVGGVYGVLAKMGRTLDRQGAATIGAPGTDEIEDEYPYKTKDRKKIDRNLAKVYSRIAKTAEQIRLEVANEVEGLSSAFTVELDSITAEIQGVENAVSFVELTVDSLTSRIQDAEGNISTLEQTATSLRSEIAGKADEDYVSTLIDQAMDSITLSASSSGGTATIKLYQGNVEVDAATMTLNVDAANVTGTLTANNVDISGLLAVKSGYSTYGYMGASTASTALGTGVAVCDSSMSNGVLAMTTGAKMMAGGTSNQVYVVNGNVGVVASGSYFHFRSGQFYPASSASTLGASSAPWGQIYSTNSAISTSDREKKNNIEYDIDGRYDTLWSMLKPCTGKYNDGTSDRTHMFLISQDVEDAITEAGLTSKDFAAFIKSPKQDRDGNVLDGYDYALRYEEFIPLCIRQIQKLQARVAELEGQNNE